MAEELRVLVPYEEWENLQKILISGSSIFQLLPQTFYPIGHDTIVGANRWLELLKKYQLQEFVKNEALMKSSKPKSSDWYFLGPVQ